MTKRGRRCGSVGTLLSSALKIKVPAGKVPAKTVVGVLAFRDAGGSWTMGFCQVDGAKADEYLFKSGPANWSAATDSWG